MSRKGTRWGLLFGLFLYAAMHATSAMADSGWCRYVVGFTYEKAGQACQKDEGIEAAAGSRIITSCSLINEGLWGGSGYSGTWAFTYFNSNGSGLYGYTYDWYCGQAISFSPGKANGEPTCHTCVGDPINAGSGNVYRREEEFHAGQWLSFARFYNSDPSAGLDTFGQHWRHAYSSHVTYVAGTTAGTGTATVTREDGKVSTYAITNGVAAGEPDIFDALTERKDSHGNPISWTLKRVDTRSTEQFDANGHLTAIQGQDGFTTALTYSTVTTPTTVAPGAGYLITITDPSQRAIQLTYTSSGLINHVTAPDGSGYTYAYTGSNLSTVTYPDGKVLTYLYNESPNNGGATTPALLTGILDESNVRFQSYSYNALGQATNDQQAGGVASYTLTYNSDGSADVLDPLGTSRHHGMTTTLGVPYVTSVDGTCESCSPFAAWAYDFDGMVNQTTDFNGNVTTYQHDGEGLLTGTVEGSSSSTPRSVQTDWNDTLHVTTERRWLDYNYALITKTDWVYNTRGQALAECRIDMSVSAAAAYRCAATGTPPAGVRRSKYTYCNAVGSSCPLVGLRLTSTGPRTNPTQTTSYSYYTTSSATNCGTPGGACYQPGDLYQITDALGHVTTYASYDGAGRVTRLTDPNGVNTDTTYTPRGWLASRTVGGSATTFTYLPYGEVQTLTDPDGVVTTYGYDSAHRLTDITDAQGNDLHYTLDEAGHKTAEQISTAAGTVVHSLSRQYNALGQITAVIDGLNQTVFNAGFSDSYDANGNLTHSADGLGIQHQQSYDALNRLVSTLDNYNGTDTATKNTQSVFAYDAPDNVEGVGDPDGLSTIYDYDGLGNRTALYSPDTGTSSDTYDAAGNHRTHTDAKGIVSTSTYDALNRRTSTSYVDTTLNIGYAYDEANAVTGCSASSPIGRLTRMVEAGVTTVFCYDGRGNISQRKQITSGQVDITQYAYTAADRLSDLSTPNQTAISYAHDSVGRISRVTVTSPGGVAAPAVTTIAWLPFGPISSYKLGNGQTVTRTYDANYRVTDLTSPALTLHFNRDAMGNIIALGNTPGANPATETYSYDSLYRLTGVSDTGAPLESYTYNPTGDRLSKTAPGLATGAYLYTTGTHQLVSIGNAARTNDTNGNTTSSVIGGETFGFGYNGRNRLAVAQRNGQTVGTYTYNALGQRIGKVAAFPQAATERYAYDQARQLIGEYGTRNRDYVWLDDLPVAVVDNTINGSVTTSVVNYVTADQLGTPRVVTDGTGAVIWSWAYQGNPFGEQQPTSTTGYVLNLRFPGQYYDAETGTNYNYFRNYESATGRYLQSDPIGLVGGINTYTYVGSNPLYAIDPQGMQSTALCANPVNAAACAAAGMAPQAGTGSGMAAIGGAAATAAAASLTGDHAGAQSTGMCPPGGSGDCYDRYEKESYRCMRWEGQGPTSDPNRWARACVDRAAIRRTLCLKGIEDGPPPWSINDMR